MTGASGAMRAIKVASSSGHAIGAERRKAASSTNGELGCIAAKKRAIRGSNVLAVGHGLKIAAWNMIGATGNIRSSTERRCMRVAAAQP